MKNENYLRQKKTQVFLKVNSDLKFFNLHKTKTSKFKNMEKEYFNYGSPLYSFRKKAKT